MVNTRIDEFVSTVVAAINRGMPDAGPKQRIVCLSARHRVVKLLENSARQNDRDLNELISAMSDSYYETLVAAELAKQNKLSAA